MKPKIKPPNGKPGKGSLSLQTVCLGAAIIISCLSAHSATLVVTNLNDSGSGSLRQAIAAAASGDTISFTITGTVSLTGGQLLITNNLTVTGLGADRLSISGSNSNRVIQISSNATVCISDLTICEGYTTDTSDEFFCNDLTPAGNLGGGLYNSGSLRLVRCTFRNNSGSFGGTSFGPCPYYGYWAHPGGSGGAIYNANVLSATACTFTENAAGTGGQGHWVFFTSNSVPGSTPGGAGGSGGAIFNQGAAFLTNCTIAGNNSGAGGEAGHDPFFGGALGGPGGSGGGIFNVGLLTLVSCTVAGNGAGPGGANTDAHSIYPRRDGVGGGIYNGNDASAELINTIVASNTHSAAPDLAGVFASKGHNFVGQEDGATGLTNGVNGDLAGSGPAPLNPMLGPLADNGGPTMTMALLHGSPALDSGADTLSHRPYKLKTDQRGFPRKSGVHVDIGAFEFQFGARAPVALSAAESPTSQFQFSFSNHSPGATFTVLCSTNPALPLNDWMVIGPPTQVAPGRFQFSDLQMAGNPRRFYRVSSP